MTRYLQVVAARGAVHAVEQRSDVILCGKVYAKGFRFRYANGDDMDFPTFEPWKLPEYVCLDCHAEVVRLSSSS